MGKISIFCLIFISCIQFVHTESEIKKLPGQRLSSEEEIKTYLNKIDVIVFVFYYKEESDKSNQVTKSLKVEYSKLQYLMEYILVNCDKSSMSQCRADDDEDMEDKFNRIEIYVPPPV